LSIKVRQDLIRDLRVSKGWTQEKLAELSSVHTRTIQRIENDGFASAQSLNALARALDIDPDFLHHVAAEIQAIDHRQKPKRSRCFPRRLTSMYHGERRSIEQIQQQAQKMQFWLSMEWVSWGMLFIGGFLTVNVLMLAQANLLIIQANPNKAAFLTVFFVGTSIGLLLMLIGGLGLHLFEKAREQRNFTRQLQPRARFSRLSTDY
jgi:transcriptional regulator with XRE-family HTH domain